MINLNEKVLYCGEVYYAREIEFPMVKLSQNIDGKPTIITKLENVRQLLTPTKKIQVDVNVPKCWQELLKIEEFENIDNMHKGSKQNDDPQPRYDDTRTIETQFPNGAIGTLQLCSGQSNYWLSAEVNYLGQTAEGDMMHQLDNTIEVENYQFNIKLV